MLVTEINEISKARYRISLDNEIAFVLYKGDLRLYNIKINSNITEETYNSILNDVLCKRAKLRTMNLLKVKDYTEKQIREKLKQGYYPLKAIDAAIKFLKEYHYLDDERFCDTYIRYHIDSSSKIQMQQKLQVKGISKELFNVVFDSQNQDPTQNELTQIKKILKKKNYDPVKSDSKEKSKIIQSLYRKGYSFELIKKEMNYYQEE